MLLVNGHIFTYAQEEENRDSDAVLDLREYGPASEVGRQPIDQGVAYTELAPEQESNTATNPEGASTDESMMNAPHQIFMPFLTGGGQDETAQASAVAEASLGAGGAAARAAGVYGDFNNDGFDDLVVGAPGEDIGTINNAGAVNIFYGSSSGLRYVRGSF
jgi:hypothetical protein